MGSLIAYHQGRLYSDAIDFKRKTLEKRGGKFLILSRSRPAWDAVNCLPALLGQASVQTTATRKPTCRSCAPLSM
ncbi:hypothetical protein, partial [Paraburkholderia aspalathi]|uniref:hypothetical protein n=1 Tax=Paraburkholderia aspalathi TaxID=1324617 RepID=UPI001F2F1AD7